MARIVLITGGSRSGKSDYAQKLAESLTGKKLFIATCPVTDDEMARRIRKHREKRSAAHWETMEEPLNVARLLRNATGYNVYLIDCLTLWVNNVMYKASEENREISEDEIVTRCEDLLAACRDVDGTVIIVTNEVGSSIVPENRLARHYRDLIGRCNQVVAGKSDTVTLVVCGLPLNLKEKE